MAYPPPSSDMNKAVTGYPASHPHPPQPKASLSDPQPPYRRTMCDDLCAVCVAAFFIFVFSVPIVIYLHNLLVGPGYPTMEVSGLTVSNISAPATTGPTWKAAVLVRTPGYYGNLFFNDVQCSLYYRWDAAQPLALASAEPFMLGSDDRTVIKAEMAMERPAEGVFDDLSRQRRSVGTVAVGLKVTMQGKFALGSWWTKGYGRIEAFCDNLKVAIAKPTGEGSLLINRDELPSCTYNSANPNPYNSIAVDLDRARV